MAKEPVKTTRALFRACNAPTNIVDLPTADGY